MNILTFDIEEWYLESCMLDRKEKYAEFDRYINLILDKLEERDTKATFFCVGEMGRLFPDVVKKIDSKGHEVGCHSNTHTWLNKMSVDECRQDTKSAIDSLEQCLGKKVLSYRAPAFSICNSNKWAFEVLVENGIVRDASVFPAARDFGGFAEFGSQRPTLVRYNGITIKEFPIPMATIFGSDVAYSGGGYFRLFPLSFIKKHIAYDDYVMTYFHLEDLMPDTIHLMSKSAYEAYFKESGIIVNRLIRYFKSNIGKKNALDKLMRIISSFDFIGLNDADRYIDWTLNAVDLGK